jgi:glycosyltransferase involved in cell wall biosynthesis
VRYVGDVGGRERQSLVAHARAVVVGPGCTDGQQLGLVQALASGTPVVAFADSPAREIVRHGVNGCLVRTEADLTAALAASLDGIDPLACRTSVTSRYEPDVVAARYEHLYRCVARAQQQRRRGPADLQHRPVHGGSVSSRRPGERRRRKATC